MVFLAIASGAKGILYYDFESLRSNPALWRKVGRINRLLTHLAPLLLSPTSEAKVGLASPDTPIVTLAKTKSEKTLLICVNTSRETVRLRLSLTGLAEHAKVTELLGTTWPRLSEDWLTATLTPLAVGLYQIVPTRGSESQP